MSIIEKCIHWNPYLYRFSHLKMKPVVCHIVQQCLQILSNVKEQTVFEKKFNIKKKKIQNAITYLTLWLEFLVGDPEGNLGFR